MGNIILGKKEYLQDYNWIPSYKIEYKLKKNEYFNRGRYLDNYLNNFNFLDPITISKPYEHVIDTIEIALKEEFKQSNINNFIPSSKFLRDILTKILKNYNRFSFLDLIQLIQHYGLVSDNYYKKNNYTIDNNLLKESFKYKYINFMGINDLHLIKSKILSKKMILFGMSITENFLLTEKEPLLKLDNKIIIGGVSGILIGFNDIKQYFILQLTKGTEWGDKGKIYIPYSYIINCNPEIYFIEIDEEKILSKKRIEINNQENIQNTKSSGKWSLIGI